MKKAALTFLLTHVLVGLIVYYIPVSSLGVLLIVTTYLLGISLTKRFLLK